MHALLYIYTFYMLWRTLQRHHCVSHEWQVGTHASDTGSHGTHSHSITSYDPDAYCNLITTYGTHYIKGVKLGGQMKAITAIKTCQATMSGLTDTAVKDCLHVEASGTNYTADVKAESHFCKEQKKDGDKSKVQHHVQ
ncbi:hypothetical protein ABG768_011455 [Culter alburnus]|uniref:MACPF domain-containing protein n=1 Tax=Culter alburnus TaxID=194366 RepID=A0AAW1Z9V2_CULAL